jgi:hypothetical protein
VTCRWHRWGPWVIEYEECPGGEMSVWRWRTRRCKRCDMIEEVPKCVSLSPEVVRGLTR